MLIGGFGGQRPPEAEILLTEKVAIQAFLVHIL